ncbi:hypothetical protein QQX98_001569 [Neonectria punicea]|uniref:Apple domain-containing protein n=1 Tax=Neonectria punicea TaxID=979145 RepID=A0ABR1HN33_9HYPO
MKAHSLLLIAILRLSSLATADDAEEATVTLLTQEDGIVEELWLIIGNRNDAIFSGEDVHEVIHGDAELDRRHYEPPYGKPYGGSNFKRFCSKYLSITPYVTTKIATVTAKCSKTITRETLATVTRTVTTQTKFITERLTITEYVTQTATDHITTTGVPRREPVLDSRHVNNAKNGYPRNKQLSASYWKVVQPKTKTITQTVKPTSTVLTTRTQTSSATALTTATVTLPVTEAATTVATVTSTIAVNPCEGVQEKGWGFITIPPGTSSNSIQAPTFQDCCEACYTTFGCVYYTYSAGVTRCGVTYQNGATDENTCPVGTRTVVYGDGPPAFQFGPCGVGNH